MAVNHSKPWTGPGQTEVRRSNREPEEMRIPLAAWLATKLPQAGDLSLTNVSGTRANGNSSETVIFDAQWRDHTGLHQQRFVARIAPLPGDMALFPTYQIEDQCRVMRLVGELSRVPVPPVRWNEPSSAHLGSPFLVMDFVEGLVPSDRPNYVFGGWVFDATARDREHMQNAFIEVLVNLHGIERPSERFSFLEYASPGETPLRRHVAHTVAYYNFVAARGGRSSLLERCWDWLDSHWPSDEPPNVLCWGDPRPGNMIFHEFDPVAVLDWEMAALGPRELDVAWLAYTQRFLQSRAESLGMPGLPDFLKYEDITKLYGALSGYQLRDMEFYVLYVAALFGTIVLRIGLRSVQLGLQPMPADTDELIINRGDLESMLFGRTLF